MANGIIELIQQMSALGFNVTTLDKFKRLSRYIIDFDGWYGENLLEIYDSKDPSAEYFKYYNIALTNPPGFSSKNICDFNVTIDMVENLSQDKQTQGYEFMNEKYELGYMYDRLKSLKSNSPNSRDEIKKLEQEISSKEDYVRHINPWSIQNSAIMTMPDAIGTEADAVPSSDSSAVPMSQVVVDSGPVNMPSVDTLTTEDVANTKPGGEMEDWAEEYARRFFSGMGVTSISVRTRRRT